MSANHALASSVVNGSMTYSDACASVLATANLTNGRVSTNPATFEEGKNVLSTIQQMYASFYKRSFNDIDCGKLMVDALSPTEHAEFLTYQTLRMPAVHAQETALASYTVVPVRTGIAGQPGTAESPVWQFAGNQYRDASNNLIFTALQPFLPVGTLEGYSEASSGNRYNAELGALYISNNPTTKTSDVGITVNPYRSHGAGIFGTQAYLLQNFGMLAFRHADGGGAMPRSFSLAFYKDAFCATAPLLRNEDVPASVIDVNHELAFRRNISCQSACHYSADSNAGLLRNFVVARTHSGGAIDPSCYFSNYPNERMLSFVVKYPSGSGTEYYRQNSTGRVLFRNYLGNLVDQPVTSFSQLGSVIANQDDYYICTAKKIYHYFTGIDAYVADPLSPNAPDLVNNDSLRARNQVIDLGLSYRTHGDTKRLIKEIFDSSAYRTGRP